MACYPFLFLTQICHFKNFDCKPVCTHVNVLAQLPYAICCVKPACVSDDKEKPQLMSEIMQ